MKRFVSAGLIASAVLATAAAALSQVSAPVSGQVSSQISAPRVSHVEIVPPLSPDQRADWNCLDAAVQAWRLHPTSTQAGGAPSAQALRDYYLGRLSAELGDERLVRDLLRKPKPIASAKATSLALCQARMARSAAALQPLEARDFTLQRAGASAQ